MNINELNVQELSTKEMKETNGGWFAIVLGIAFLAGLVYAYYDNK